jgi:hypothetical protein
MLKHESLEMQIDAILAVDDDVIEKHIAEIALLQTALTVLDAEFEMYQQCHCNKTGRPLHKIGIDCFQQLINTNDKRRSKIALEAYHTSQYCLDWLFTDDIALDELFNLDPVGYAVYSIGLVYGVAWDQQKMPVWKRHLARIAAWQKCNAMFQSNPHLIIKTNEYMRRFLGLINPAKHQSVSSLVIFNLESLFDSDFNIEMYQESVQEMLMQIVKKNYNEKLLVTPGTVANIKSKYSGIQSFARQCKLKGMTNLDAVMYDLRDFMGQKTPNQVEVHVGLRAKKTSQNVFKQEAGKPIELKLKPENKTSTTRTNAFSTMFAKQRGNK